MGIINTDFQMPGKDRPPQTFYDLKTQQGQINWLAQFLMSVNNVFDNVEGNVTTLETGATPYVDITFDDETNSASFDFYLPPGEQGEPGNISEVTATATTLAPGSSATASVQLDTSTQSIAFNFGLPEGTPATDAQTASAVNAWLVAHPEATTTVQDGSITPQKLNSDTYNEFITTTYEHMTAIPANSNLDNYKTPGNYYVASGAIGQTITNYPASIGGVVIVRNSTASSGFFQFVIDGDGQQFIRKFGSNAWSVWYGDITAPGIALVSNQNINDLVNVGAYRASYSVAQTLVNWPTLSGGVKAGGRLICLPSNSITMNIQVAIIENVIFIRSKSSGVWSSWSRFAKQDEFNDTVITNVSRMTRIDSNSNIDDISTPGNYYIPTSSVSNTLTGLPFDMSGKITVSHIASSAGPMQIAVDGVGNIYWRAKSGGNWTDWNEVNTRQVESAVKGTANMVSKIIEELPYKIEYANSPTPIGLRNYIGNTQNVHPKVLYFENGFGGHKYWLAYTPYPYSRSHFENPCIAYSDDGLTWTNINNNPLDYTTGTAYNSDTHLVYNDNSQELECWYRLNGPADQTPREETIYRRVSSDGITWSNEEQVFSNTTGNYADYVSPCIIYDNGTYHIWVISNTSNKIKYYTAQESTISNWTFVREYSITFTDSGYTVNPWHLDVIKDGTTYIMLVMCRRNTNTQDNPCSLFITTSSDNVTYTTPVIVIKGSEYGWDTKMYRSSIVKIGNKYRIYYSAGRPSGNTIYSDTVWGIGISESNTLSNFIGKSVY